jgi:O-antigen/teichoic acid export membrane protein
VIRNTAFMMIGTIARLLTGVVLFVVLARTWGAHEFGKFVYPLTLASLLVIFAEFGFSLQIVREISRTPDRLASLVTRAIAARAVLASLVVAGTAIWLISQSRSIRQAALLVVVLLLATLANSFAAFLNLPFRAVGRFATEAWLAIAANVGHFALIVGVVLGGGGLVVTSVAFLFSRCLYLAGSLIAYRRAFGPLALGWSTLSTVPSTLRAGIAFGIFVAVGTLYFQIDTVIVEWYLGATAVGWYQAGMRVLMIGLVLPEVWSNVYLPAIARTGGDSSRQSTLSLRLTRQLMVLGVVGLAVCVQLGDWINHAILGPGFEPVSALLPLFGVVLVLRFVASAYGTILSAIGQQSARTGIVIGAVVVSVAGNALLIHSVGLRGAVLAAIVTHVYLVVAYLIVVRRLLGRWPIDGRSASLAGLAILPFLFQSSLAGRASLVVGIAVACVMLGTTGPEWRRLFGGLMDVLRRPGPQAVP